MQKDGQKALLIVLFLAAVLRFAGITCDSLWLDESYQTLASSVGQRLPDFTIVVDQPFLFRFGPPRQLAELLSHFRQVDPLCPPLYPVLLNRWMALFGDSDLALRSLSAVLSTVSVAVVFWCARLLFGPGPALLAALLQTVSPFDIHYGQEARMYSLSILLSALSCGSFFAILRSSQVTKQTCIAIVIYVVATWALINTHYTALFVAVFQGLFGLWLCVSRHQWRLLAMLSIAWVSVLVLWLPWLEMFRQAAAVRSGTFYVARQPSWWWPVWALCVRIPLNWIVFLAGKKVVAYAVPIYLTSVSLLASALLASRRKESRPAPLIRGTGDIVPAPLATAYVWCWALLPALFVWLVDVIENHRVIEVSRYVSATAPAIYVLAGLGLASMGAFAASRSSRTLMAARAVLIAHVVFALVNNVHDHFTPQREPWREMAAEVESRCRPDQLILVSQYYDIACLDRYLSKPELQVGVSPAQGPDHISKVVSGRHEFWLVTAQEGESATSMIPPQFKCDQEVHLSHGLHLRYYRKR